MEKPHIAIIKKPTPRALKEVNHLLSQLSLTRVSPAPMTLTQWKALLFQKNVFFLAAMSSRSAQGKMIGFLVIYFVRIPSGLLAIAEDLVVDEPYRKWGTGRVLMEYGIGLAEKKKARHLSLRTNPKRIQANKLYPQMGFHLMTTNFFRMNLPREK